jgi:pilus assembly protein CpaB
VPANTGRAFIILALLLGGLAAVVGYYSLTTLATQAAARNRAAFAPVVVTAGDLTFGTRLERNQLRVVRYPKESIPAGAYADPESVVGQVTKVFLSAREPVTATKLSSRGGGLSMLVRPSMRATSVEVNQVSGVSGFVLPGDRVDVLCTVDQPGVQQEAVTRTILQNCEVLAAGQKVQQHDNKPVTVQSVTVLVDPKGAESVALALHQGKVHLVLRNPEDMDTVTVASLSTSEMLGQAPKPAVAEQKPAARHAPPPRPRVSSARPAAKPVVRIIREAKVTESPAPKDTSNSSGR